MARRIKGEGSIYQRESDGRWIGTVDLGWVGGRRVRKTVSGRTLQEVRPKFKALKAQLEMGVTPDDATIEVWLTHWLDEVAAPNLRPRTVAVYRGYAKNWIVPAVGKIRLQSLKTDHVRAMLKTMDTAGLSTTSQRQAYMILRTALAEAVTSQRITDNVVTRVKAPIATKNHHGVLSRDDSLALIELLAAYGDDGDWRTASRFLCALLEGLRQGEALGLRWEDVDLSPGAESILLRRAVQRIPGQGLMVTPLKTDLSARLIPLLPPVVSALRAHREAGEEGYVWGGDSPTDPRRDWGEWKMILWSAGVEDKPLHAARATTASILGEARVPMKTIADILGHSQITTAWNHYIHTDDRQRREGMEAGWASLTALSP